MKTKRPPRTIAGGFEVVKELGKGAYGKVNLCKDKKTDELVAIKSVSKDYVAKLGKIKHVFREKDLLSELIHPFIIKLKDTRMVSSFISN